MPLKIERVLISDKIDASCKKILEESSIQVDYKAGLTKDELLASIVNYDALIVRSATKVTDEVFKNATRLKLVGRAGTGVDNINLEVATKHGVLVMNTPGGNTLSAAEHTCAMISALARNIGQGHASMVEGKWERSKFMGCELMGKTLAIIGLGRIGREVAHRMRSFGMKTIGYDPLVSKEEAATFNVEYVQLEEMWPLADFITVHVPLITPTRGMINTKVFDCCKPGVKVVNVARGGIIDENDLLTALNSGKCGGAALDVFVTEPPKDTSLEIVKHPKVLATPHLGASTVEAQKRVAQEIAEQIVDAVNGKAMFGLVNAPALSESGNPKFKAWIDLAEKLGKMISLVKKDCKIFELVTTGDNLKSAGKLLTCAFSNGLLNGYGVTANIISAFALVKQHGFEVKCNHDATEPATMISVKVENQVYTGIVSGGKPSLITYESIDLVSSVSLTKNVIVGCSDSSSSSLQNLVQNMDVLCMSTGFDGKTTVLVAIVEGDVDQTLQEPFNLIKL